MAWTAPRTWTVGEIPTAAMFNTHLRDQLVDLDARTTVQTNAVDPTETTTSASYTDLATVGPSVTMVTGSRAVVAITAGQWNNTTGNGAAMSFSVSGASSIAASDFRSLKAKSAVADTDFYHSAIYTINLSPGSNTFTCKYRRDLGGTANFSRRAITVWAGNQIS